jgi:hypothetical protein
MIEKGCFKMVWIETYSKLWKEVLKRLRMAANSLFALIKDRFL